MDVFLKAAIKNVLQQPAVAMIVFRRDDHQSIGTFHPRSETWVFYRLPSIVGAQRQLGDVNQLSFYRATLLEFIDQQACRVRA